METRSGELNCYGVGDEVDGGLELNSHGTLAWVNDGGDGTDRRSGSERRSERKERPSLVGKGETRRCAVDETTGAGDETKLLDRPRWAWTTEEKALDLRQRQLGRWGSVTRRWRLGSRENVKLEV